MRSAGCALAMSAALVASTIFGPAADQDLPVTPVAVAGHHLGQHAGLAHVQATGRLTSG